MEKEFAQRQPSMTLEENLKKATTELLVLRLLLEREYYIGEITATLHKKSGGILKIVFPYSAVYRLQESGYIAESEKRNAPDGRRRQFLCITDNGREYYQQLVDFYRNFVSGVNMILDDGCEEGEQSPDDL
jgi:PadR family transcriptional regulator PadR